MATALSDDQMQAQRELPRYRCHKEVWALKIAEIESQLGGPDPKTFLHVADPGYAPIVVTEEYMRKHDPQVGGYWVRYADGYESWSPAEAFESGYTLVG